MTLGSIIASLRKQHNITQEALAQQLGVTNQAVSKWESDICCPDVTLLPKIADIFDVSMDTLFGRKDSETPDAFEGDDSLRIVLMRGSKRLLHHSVCKEITINWQGDILNLHSDFSVNCEDVHGDVHAGGSVNCDEVNGSVNAGGNVNCDDVNGPVHAGGNVTCEDVEGNVQAGGMATCGSVSGRVNSGKDVMSKLWKDMMP